MFITPSRLLREKMIAGGWAHERLEHIPTFVYPLEIGDRPKKRQILYAGRINPQKGVDILIRAVAKVQGMRSFPSFATVIAGNGGREYLDSLQTLCEQEGTRDVAFVGEVTKDRLAELFQDSLVSVAPSISYDNAPNVMLESMACGTPVIASNQGSFPELITHEHNGLLFQTRSVDGLADALIRVLEREIEVREMGAKARAFVLRNHSPELHYQKLMNVYSKLST
jgi:glycosyltransferase involved in cell wall biosynthesis